MRRPSCSISVTARPRSRQLHIATGGVDVALELRQPVGELERRVAQRASASASRTPPRSRPRRSTSSLTAPARDRLARIRPARNPSGTAQIAISSGQSRALDTPSGPSLKATTSIEPERGHRGAGPQDRLEHPSLGGPGGAPAAHEEHAEPDEHDEDQRRDDGVDDVHGGRAGRDQHEVLRAVGTARVEWAEQRGQRRQDRGDPRDHDDRALHAGADATRRIAHEHLDERADPQPRQEHADVEDQRRVGVGQPAEEPDEAHKRHQRASPVLRTAPPRVQAGADEAPPHGDREHEGPAQLVVARQRQRERDQPGRQAGDREPDQRAPQAAHGETQPQRRRRVHR